MKLLLKEFQTKTVVEAQGKVEVRAVQWRVGGETTSTDDATMTLNIADENLLDVFEAAGRKFGEGLHKAWWRMRGTTKIAGQRARRELIALSLEAEVPRRIDALARQTVQAWLKSHNQTIATLSDVQRQAYDEIRRLATEPELTPLVYPTQIDGRVALRDWEAHVFVAPATGKYPQTFNAWETRVIEAELEREDMVAWLRNPERKPWSLCIPYHSNGDWHGLYPDFLMVRRVGKGLVVDLLDPHSLGLADAPDKAKGLALYADKHAHAYGRIEMIVIDDEEIRRVDLTDEVVREKVKAGPTHASLRLLFSGS